MQRERHAASLTDCILQLVALWHLGVKRRKKTGPSVGERLQAVHEKVLARKGKK
jgi:hypothetical protein